MNNKFNLRDAINAIGNDILWHENNPDKALSSDYQKGFINGLIQARYIIGELSRGEGVTERQGQQSTAFEQEQPQ